MDIATANGTSYKHYECFGCRSALTLDMRAGPRGKGTFTGQNPQFAAMPHTAKLHWPALRQNVGYSGITVLWNIVEFHKLRRGIWQNLPQKNDGPASNIKYSTPKDSITENW